MMNNQLPTVICLLPSDLCLLTSDLCLRIFTTVESALQITSFLTNKANFQKSQMNVSAVKTMNYEQITMNNANKNKPKTNPIKPNLVRRRRIANERNFFYNKGLQKKR